MMKPYSSILSGLGVSAVAFFSTGEAVAEKPTASAPAEPAKELRVAAVQMRSGKDLEENLKRTIQFIARCAKDGARVVVFPECSVTGYLGDAPKSATAEQLAAAEHRIGEACKEHKVYAIVGMPWRENGRLFNSAVILSPEGKVIERYHKVHLAEAWPDPGDHLSVYKIDGVKCTTIICHDERYPELVRLPVLLGAQIVFYISSESGLHEESKIDPYRAQIQARAVENGVWVVQANAPANPDASGSHGQSRIITPGGNIVQEASMFGEDVVISTLKISQAGRTNATRSLESEPWRSWWQQGMKLVRIIE
jgi:predicted amidohydrolase